MTTALVTGANKGIGLERKADGSPVTRADREAESTIRERLMASYDGEPIDILGVSWGRTVLARSAAL